MYKIFNAAKDLDEFISIALYVRDEINMQLFVYVFYLVVSHRFDNIALPNIFEIIPQNFYKKDILQQLKEASVQKNEVIFFRITNLQ